MSNVRFGGVLALFLAMFAAGALSASGHRTAGMTLGVVVAVLLPLLCARCER